MRTYNELSLDEWVEMQRRLEGGDSSRVIARSRWAVLRARSAASVGMRRAMGLTGRRRRSSARA